MHATVRLATPDDLDSVTSLMQDDCSSTGTSSSSSLLLSRITGGDIWIVERDGFVVGLLRIDRMWPEAIPLIAWVNVLPNFRGIGYYRRLTNAAEANLISEGYKYALYSACESRPHMIALFRRDGMRQCGQLSFPNGLIELFFWKDLAH